MTERHLRAAHVVAASLLYLAAEASSAAGQIGAISSSGEILAGQSSSDSSTTIASQGQIFLDPAQTSATMRIGFNVNADAEPGLLVPEIGIASFDMTFTLDHAASFDLSFDFLLRGQLARAVDQECQGSIGLADISIAKLVRVRDGAEFPLDVVLPGASLDFDATAATFNMAQQDSRTLQFRGEPVETTAYRLSFVVSATAISQSCEVSARFGADNGLTTGCTACVYPGFPDRVRDQDGLFVTVTVSSLCGDVRLDAGEECDFGPANGTPETCCDAFCRAAPSTQVCRPAAGECDQAETCQSNGCPEDKAKPAGTACSADRSLCTADVCDAAGACVHPLLAGTTCDANDLCTCDHDGLFCTGPVQCPRAGGLCILLPTPCVDEDDTCDEEHDICASQLGTPTPTATSVTPPVPTPTATAVGGVCAGDCDGDRMVVINELVLGVNIALGAQPVSACAAFDGNSDGSVVINELITGVNNALAGCRT